MKKLVFLIAMKSIILTTFTQPWTDNLPKDKDELTLYDHRSAFNEYWKPFNVDKGFYEVDGKKVKASGWRQFQRWYHYMEGLIDPETGNFPAVTAQHVYNKYIKENPNAKSPTSANWTSMGPSLSEGGYAGVGRLNCVEFHPTDNSVFWVGAPSGGIWVTTNAGNSWTCLNDDNNVLGASDIVVPPDYVTSQTIYIATGDRGASDNNSIGVVKSTDGGQTWNETGLTFAINEGRKTPRLLMDPNNYQVLIAATTAGVYKTTDGGDTWDKISSLSFVDMEYKPEYFYTLYGSTWNGGIYKSTDGGQNWTQTLTTSGRRTEIAVTPANPAVVYALITAASNGLYGVYKSTDSGQTFQQVAGSYPNMLDWGNGGDSGGQGWYDLCIAASPVNADIVLIGGINTWRSTNGGTVWNKVSHWFDGAGYPATHADKHMLKFRNNGDLFEANDGGIYISTTEGTEWNDITNGMIISQMYKLGVSQTEVNSVITGLQDNGTKYLNNTTWNDVIGGDGMECLIDYTNAQIQYGALYYGDIRRTTNRWSSLQQIKPSGAGDGDWITPYIIHPTTPTTLYAGYADVWKTTNRGTNWTKISTLNVSNKIKAIAISKSNPKILYITNHNNIWKTENEGGDWINVTGTLPSTTANIREICIKANDPNTVWVALSGYNNHCVYQTTNGGDTWVNISAGFPPLPTYSIVQNIQISSEDHLYAGSELGIYFKKGFDNWIPYNTGLPNVKIGEIEIYYDDNDPSNSKLRAATYGRGLWETPVFYSAGPMTYTTSTATQPETNGVKIGSKNAVILRMEIETTGMTSPLNIAKLTISMAGTTDINDIDNVKIFSTGSNPEFNTNKEFGVSMLPATGNLEFSDNIFLNSGKNYFWLTCNISETATIGNTINATFISSEIEYQIYYPTVSNPGDGRPIIGLPQIITSVSEINFDNVKIGEHKVIEYDLSGLNLPSYISIFTSGNFTVSKNSTSGFTTNMNYIPEGDIVETKIYARFSPTAEKEYNSQIRHTSLEAENLNIAVSGFGNTVGFTDTFDPEAITVYPNPSNSIFNIYNPNQTILKYTVTDYKGRLLEENTVNSGSINVVDLTNYVTGIYFVQFISNDKIYMLRLIRQ
jgi:photosystem II stability/assembly factor-like uncharacterized protein